jgi:hypothetical protein
MWVEETLGIRCAAISSVCTDAMAYYCRPGHLSLVSFGQQQQQDSREVEIKSRRIDFNDARSPIIYTEKKVYTPQLAGWLRTGLLLHDARAWQTAIGVE